MFVYNVSVCFPKISRENGRQKVTCNKIVCLCAWKGGSWKGNMEHEGLNRTGPLPQLHMLSICYC